MPSSVGWPRTGPGVRVVDVAARGDQLEVAGGQRRLAVALDALGVGAVERQAGEELGRHAAAAAGVEVRALRAGAAGLRAAQVGEQLGVLPHPLEAALVADVAGEEVLVDGERAGVDVADRVDQADHPAGAAEVEPGQGLAERRQVEERVAGEHVVAVGQQPVVEVALLGLGGVQLVPDVGPAAGRAQPGDPQLGAVGVGERLELVELAGVLAGDDDGDLEVLHPGLGQVLQRPGGGGEGAGAADGVVDLGRRAVQGDLDVDVVGAGQLRRARLVQLDAVGGELDADVVADGVVEQVPEVRPDGRLAAADVDVEDLHPLQLVDDRARPRRWTAPAGPAVPRRTGSARTPGCRRR